MEIIINILLITIATIGMIFYLALWIAFISSYNIQKQISFKVAQNYLQKKVWKIIGLGFILLILYLILAVIYHFINK